VATPRPHLVADGERVGGALSCDVHVLCSTLRQRKSHDRSINIQRRFNSGKLADEDVDPKELERARRKKARHAIFVASLSALPPSFKKRSAYDLDMDEFDRAADEAAIARGDKSRGSFADEHKFFRHGCLERDFFSDLEETGR
jgi:hypothetical protein